jgi:putative transposase
MSENTDAVEGATTLVAVSPPSVSGDPPEQQPQLSAAEQDAVRELVRQARASGTSLTGPGGLLKQLTKMVVEAALDEEMSEHLGYDKGAPEGRNRGNSRNGRRTKTVVTDNAGRVDIVVPRDRDGSFAPVVVRKRQRRLGEVDEVVLSLYAKGLTTGEISAHFADVYGASVSEDVVGRITDKVVAEMQAWWARPLEKVYAAIFIDAIMVKVRDGQVRNRPVYAAIGVDLPKQLPVTKTSWACGPATATLESRGVREVLVRRADRPEGPRGQGRLLRRL